jgi:putative transposase
MTRGKGFLRLLGRMLAHDPLRELALAENEFLRVQLQAVLQATRGRIALTNEQRRHLAELGLRLGSRLHEACLLVQPRTLLKWHRQFVARKFDGSKQRGLGRPRLSQEIIALVLRLARENPTWGYNRIAGALANLGHTLCDQTVDNLLARHGLPPSGDRKKSASTWRQFLATHRDVIWGADFFTTEVWCGLRLVTFHTLFFVHHQTRRVVIGGITPHPHAAWVEQVARNLTAADGELEGARFVIHDRDTKCQQASRIDPLTGVEI